MIVWLDAQLPPALATWFRVNAGVEAFALRDLGLRDASDAAIFSAAQQPHHIVVSKDIDFVHLVERFGVPPQIVHLTCGNLTNASLIELFEKHWDVVRHLLAAGEPVVEVG
jgi:predicted nuclease of predicted toxin-antitoxin system